MLLLPAAHHLRAAHVVAAHRIRLAELLALELLLLAVREGRLAGHGTVHAVLARHHLLLLALRIELLRLLLLLHGHLALVLHLHEHLWRHACSSAASHAASHAACARCAAVHELLWVHGRLIGLELEHFWVEAAILLRVRGHAVAI